MDAKSQFGGSCQSDDQSMIDGRMMNEERPGQERPDGPDRERPDFEPSADAFLEGQVGLRVVAAPEADDTAEELDVIPGQTPSKLLTGSLCEICGGEQAAIRINVDGNTLLMESCEGCDVRRWQLAGERIDLQEALNQVGEHSGRRR